MRPLSVRRSYFLSLALAGISAVSLPLLSAGCAKPAPMDRTRVVATARTGLATLVNSMILQAEFEPYQDILLHGKVSGYISLIKVDIGDRVKAGDLIATVEAPELRDQLQSALAAAERAKADFQIAKLNSDRMEEVGRSQPGLIAQQDLDDVVAKKTAAEAALAAARAEADRYQALSAYTRITAPFAGVITRRYVDLGSLLESGTSSNSEPVVELVQDSLLRLRFPIPEAETPQIRNGQNVRISVGSLHREFTGTIARSSGAIDRATRTMVAEVDVPNLDGSLKTGMYASVSLPIEEAKSVLAIPLQALSAGDHPSVWLVDVTETAHERPVTVGIRTADFAQVISGLAGGDRVIVSDRGGLRAGDAVSAQDITVPAQD